MKIVVFDAAMSLAWNIWIWGLFMV